MQRRKIMGQLPAPETIFGSQGLTQEDTDAQGSRFRDVKAAIFANPYQPVWGAPNTPPLPHYKTTNKSVYAGSFPGGLPPQFKLASIRALDSTADLRWGEDGTGFRRLVRPHGVCVTGIWAITADNPYSGYFKQGSQGLVIARISAGVTMTLRGRRRSYGIALKLYPTVDETHEHLLHTANVFLVDDLGGTTASHLTEVELTNAPQVTGFNRGNEIPILLKEGLVFALVDRMATMRQVYPIAELGQAAHAPTYAPAFLRVKAAAGQPVIDEPDVRHEVLAHIFDKGNPQPQRTLSLEIAVSETGKKSGFAFFPKGQRHTITHWQTIGQLTFNDGVASYNGDFVLHFRHPTWRNDRNDPSTAVRQQGKKVRWF
jgi:hypothetical protein